MASLSRRRGRAANRMLHTIISATDIFTPEPIARPAFYPRGSGGGGSREGACGDRQRETADGPVIESLISTNPFDYLNPSFAPGRIYRPGRQ